MFKWLILVNILFCFACSSDLKSEQTFYKNGQVKTSGYSDKKGNLQGEFTTYYENGKISSIAVMVDNKLDGIFKQFYENGKILSITSLSNNIPDGISKCFYKSGKLELESVFRKGVLILRTLYYPSGKVKGQICGKIHGINGDYNSIVFFDENGRVKKEDNGRKSRFANINYINDGKSLNIKLIGNNDCDSIIVKFKRKFGDNYSIRKMTKSKIQEFIIDINYTDYYKGKLNILIESYYSIKSFSLPNVKIEPFIQETCIQLDKGEKPAKYNIDPIW
jgi:hypothetical protein